MKLRHVRLTLLFAAVAVVALAGSKGAAKPPPGRKPPALKLQVVHTYLDKNRGSILKRPRHKYDFKGVQITLCTLDDLLRKRPLFYDGLNEKALKTAIKDPGKTLWFVQVPFHSHIGVVVAVDPEKHQVLAHARYIIGE